MSLASGKVDLQLALREPLAHTRPFVLAVSRSHPGAWPDRPPVPAAFESVFAPPVPFARSSAPRSGWFIHAGYMIAWVSSETGQIGMSERRQLSAKPSGRRHRRHRRLAVQLFTSDRSLGPLSL